MWKSPIQTSTNLWQDFLSVAEIFSKPFFKGFQWKSHDFPDQSWALHIPGKKKISFHVITLFTSTLGYPKTEGCSLTSAYFMFDLFFSALKACMIRLKVFQLSNIRAGGILGIRHCVHTYTLSWLATLNALVALSLFSDAFTQSFKPGNVLE